MRFLKLIAALLWLAPGAALAEGPHFKTGRFPSSGGARPLKPAAVVESLPASLDMRVGEKRSFRVNGAAVCGDPNIARCTVTEKVFTVAATGRGKTFIFVMEGVGGGKKPNAGALQNKPKQIEFNVR